MSADGQCWPVVAQHHPPDKLPAASNVHFPLLQDFERERRTCACCMTPRPPATRTLGPRGEGEQGGLSCTFQKLPVPVTFLVYYSAAF